LPSTVNSICDYFENIESKDVVPNVQPGDIAKMIAGQSILLFLFLFLERSPQFTRPNALDSAPEEGQPWSEIAADFDRVIMPG